MVVYFMTGAFLLLVPVIAYSIRQSFKLSYPESEKYNVIAVLVGVFAGLIGFVGVVIVLVAYTAQIDAESDLDQVHADEEVLTQRRDELETLIRSELDDYPEFEAGIIDGINPEILLSFPQLTSNVVLLAKVETLVEINQSIYDIQIEANKIIYDAERRNNGAIVPSWLVPDLDLTSAGEGL